jgi:hypothetical protein
MRDTRKIVPDMRYALMTLRRYQQIHMDNREKLERPYASMDELPNITLRGQMELRALLGL